MYFFFTLQFLYTEKQFHNKSSKIGEGVGITEEITNSCYKNAKSDYSISTSPTQLVRLRIREQLEILLNC